jgi:hypothetical protein
MINSKECWRKVLCTICGYCPCIFMRKTTKIRSQVNRTLGKESIPEFLPNRKSRSVWYSIATCVPASCGITGIRNVKVASHLRYTPLWHGARYFCISSHLYTVTHLQLYSELQDRGSREMFIRISSCGLLYNSVSTSDCIASNVTTTDGRWPG